MNRAAPEPRRILVVEDDQTIASVMVDVFRENGYTVTTASNGAEALAKLDTVQPHVVILDLLMPVMHGWAFMESYIEKTGGHPIPIVVVSVNPVLPRSYDKFGVRRCVAKPFRIEDLLEAVEDACGPVAA